MKAYMVNTFTGGSGISYHLFFAEDDADLSRVMHEAGALDFECGEWEYASGRDYTGAFVSKLKIFDTWEEAQKAGKITNVKSVPVERGATTLTVQYIE